ncbi:hypothetical protein AX14_011079 [Amanita brunnescens Koide BX004]|nr:hypothetical protein AX14_011079 [Amanita brunnescens Koide BX004]
MLDDRPICPQQGGLVLAVTRVTTAPPLPPAEYALSPTPVLPVPQPALVTPTSDISRLDGLPPEEAIMLPTPFPLVVLSLSLPTCAPLLRLPPNAKVLKPPWGGLIPMPAVTYIASVSPRPPLAVHGPPLVHTAAQGPTPAPTVPASRSPLPPDKMAFRSPREGSVPKPDRKDFKPR